MSLILGCLLVAHSLPIHPLHAQQADGQSQEQEINKLMALAKSNNLAYERLGELCSRIGPRVTGSPQLMKADLWAETQFRKYGFTNVHLEQWDTVPDGFYRGTHNFGQMDSPTRRTIVFSTNNWTPGTNGKVKGPVFEEPKTVGDITALGSKLKGAWILMPGEVFMGGPNLSKPKDLDLALDKAGIAGRLYSSRSELVWSHGNYKNIDPNHLPTRVMLTIRKSDYAALDTAISEGQHPTATFAVDNIFTGKPQPVYDVVADYPGTDLKDQIVVIGGHFDSWNSPGSQGAMDNGTGSMIAMEAARLLMTSGVSHRRTVRVILYAGEEEGLLGSMGYCKAHANDLDQFVGVLNDDGGSNDETGFTLLKGSEPMMQGFTETVNHFYPESKFSINYDTKMSTGGSDHSSWVEYGVPAIDYWKAPKPVNYGYIWHTQNDNFKNVYRAGLEQSSAVSALTLYWVVNSNSVWPRPVSQKKYPAN